MDGVSRAKAVLEPSRFTKDERAVACRGLDVLMDLFGAKEVWEDILGG